MTECALIAVSQCIDLRVVDRAHRISVQLLELRLKTTLAGLFFGLLQLFCLELCDDRFALMRSLDVHARGFEVAARKAIEGEPGGEHDFFVVVPPIRQRLVVDQQAARTAQQLLRVCECGFLPNLHLRIRSHPGGGAFLVPVSQAFKLAQLKVIQQVFAAVAIVAFKQPDGTIDIARRGKIDRVGQFRVIAAKRGAALQRRQQQGRHRNSGRQKESWGQASQYKGPAAETPLLLLS